MENVSRHEARFVAFMGQACVIEHHAPRSNTRKSNNSMQIGREKETLTTPVSIFDARRDLA
jgi:hypothetical protein